jgi:hypothetical protein
MCAGAWLVEGGRVPKPTSQHPPLDLPLLVAARRRLTPDRTGDSGRTLHQIDDGAWESFYRTATGPTGSRARPTA